MTRCETLPAQHYAAFGEAISLFREYDRVVAQCEGNSAEDCAEAIFALADVSEDGRLSSAEIGRVLRAAGFFVSYEWVVANRADEGGDLWAGAAVPISDLYGSTILASLAGPVVTNNLVQSYDYDGDGFLSLEELLQDRGPVSTMGVGGSFSIAASHAAFNVILSSLPSVASSFVQSLFLGGLR